MAPKIGPLSFGAFEEEVPVPTQQGVMLSKDMYEAMST